MTLPKKIQLVIWSLQISYHDMTLPKNSTWGYKSHGMDFTIWIYDLVVVIQNMTVLHKQENWLNEQSLKQHLPALKLSIQWDILLLHSNARIIEI